MLLPSSCSTTGMVSLTLSLMLCISKSIKQLQVCPPVPHSHSSDLENPPRCISSSGNSTVWMHVPVCYKAVRDIMLVNTLPPSWVLSDTISDLSLQLKGRWILDKCLLGAYCKCQWYGWKDKESTCWLGIKWQHQKSPLQTWLLAAVPCWPPWK